MEEYDMIWIITALIFALILFISFKSSEILQNSYKAGKYILAFNLLIPFVLVVLCLYFHGYNQGQRDASHGIQKGSVSKSYWMNKQVIEEMDPFETRFITIIKNQKSK